MKSLFWKEWRENLRWALIALVVVGAAMAYTLRTDPNDYYGSSREVWQGLQSGQFLMVTVFGFPVIGVALGFLQILTELKRDQWAFLVHRPVTRNEIFWGKALPGSLLYILATGLPLIFSAWWLSQPGHLAAPFDIRQIWPGVVDLIIGLGFYFGALLSGILPGPWYGRRALPLLAACFGTAAAKSYQLSTSLEGAILVLLALFIAAWAAYQRFGLFRGQPWWGKAAAVLVMLLGLSTLASWLWIGWGIVQPPAPYVSTNYGFLKSGELVKITSQANWYKSVVTLDGREIQPQNKATFDWQDFINSTYLYLHESPSYIAYRQARSYFTPVYVYSGPYAWYYIDKEDHYVAYDRIAKTIGGYMGPGGFAKPEDEAKAGRFDSTASKSWNEAMVICQDGVYVPDFISQTIKNIYTPAPGESVNSASLFYPENGSSDAPKDYVISTPQKLVFLPAGKPQITVPEIPNTELYQTLQIFRVGNGEKYFLLYDPRDSKKTQTFLREVSGQGELISQREIPNIREGSSGISLVAWVRGALDPLGNRIWNQAITWAHEISGDQRATPIWKYEPGRRAYTLKFWYASLIASLICVGLVQIPLRRVQFTGQRIVWSIFILFYGPGGLLAFYIVQNWPRREVCMSCQKKRTTEREKCEHCGAAWPKPQRDGTEIFEAAK